MGRNTILRIAVIAALGIAISPSAADDRCTVMAPVVQELADAAVSFEIELARLIGHLPPLEFQRDRNFRPEPLDLPDDAQRSFHDFENETHMLVTYTLPDYISRTRILMRELQACSGQGG